MQASAALSPSPSLGSYSATASKLAEIAARVVDELGLDPDPFGCCDDDAVMDFGCRGSTGRLLRPPGEEAGREERERTQFENEDVEEAEEVGEEEEGEFEFAFVCGGPGSSSPISADEIFYNGQIRPVYPVFNRDLLLNGVAGREEGEDGSKKTTTKLRLPLKKLLSEDREWTSSSSSSSTSSSESDDLDGLTPGSYCVWRPKDQSSAAAAAAKRCGKSNSTGSSKRWRFRDLLLNRSSSDGKDTFLLVAPSTKKRDKIIGESKRVAAVAEDDDEGDVGNGGVTPAAPDAGDRDEGKRKPPLLPPRADLGGFLANASGLSRNLKLHPF